MAPANVAAIPGNNRVLLSWNSGSGPTGTYSIFRGTAQGSEGSVPIASGLSSTHFIDTSVVNQVTYFYTVKATNSTGTSGASSEARVTLGAPVTGVPLYQVNAGGPGAGSFAADEFFTGGNSSKTANAIDLSHVIAPAPESSYQAERSGANFSYRFSNLTPGKNYLVRLHFAEFYWTATWQRVFNVSINGQLVIQNFDIVAAAEAPNTALVEQFTVSADATGAITESYLNAAADQPKASAIEIYQ